VDPFAASKNNQQGQKGHEQGVGMESLTMGQALIPFPPARRSGVTDGIFFNGVVPWEILIIVFFLNLTTISQICIKIAVLGYKHFMLEFIFISINMGTEALFAG
jgi:hypothetical protein